MRTILITGGARSGKSRLALEMAQRSGGKVLFVATATAGDEEMRQRIAQHRKMRPEGWRTLEAPAHVGNQIREHIADGEAVIVDCVTLLVNNVFSKYTDADGELADITLVEQDVQREIGELIDCATHCDATFIIVTNEVGLGIVPANRMARVYRDMLGWANQRLAQRADEVYWTVAGLPVRIKPA